MNIQDLIRPNVKVLKPYSSARDEYQEINDNIVFLDANENPFENGVNRYPDPQQIKLKIELSKIKNVNVNNILLGNGSDEVLDLIIRVFCEPRQDNIVIQPPTYGMYEVLANVNAIEIIKVELANNFQPQVEQILEASNENSKLLFLCSPNNPTGNSFNTKAIENLLNSFQGIIVIDEAYIDFSVEESWLNRLEEFSNLIVTQTLSKAYGMAGIRLGVCYASSEIIFALNKIKPPYNVNALTQRHAIEKVLDQESVNIEVYKILNERSILSEELQSIIFVKTIFPSDANFILIRVDDANKRYNQLIKKGIVIRNRSNQALCHNCLRLTVGTAEENKILITALKFIE
jgi:histidinol-phosphate aminotransferase